MSLSLTKLFRKKSSNVSSLVRSRFHSKFPNAKQVFWQQVDFYKWQVNFTLKRKKYSALFNSQGKWMETASIVPIDKIPEPKQFTFQEKYSKEGLIQIFHLQTPNSNLYEMEWQNGKYGIELIYDFTGRTMGRMILYNN